MHIDGQTVKSVCLKEGTLDEELHRYYAHESFSVGIERQYIKKYGYDGLLAEVNYKSEGEAIVKYEYDKYDKLVQTTTVTLDNEVKSTEKYGYKEYGEMETKSYSGTVSQTYS